LTMETEKKLKIGHLGCGGHSHRNIFTSYAFSPVELMAVCDLDEEKAKEAARKFGALRHYTDLDEMLESEELDALFIVSGYDSGGRPLYPELTIRALEKGVHVWIEKPPASSVKEIEEMAEASKKAGKHVLVGFKKAFTPSADKVREVIHSEEFGEPHSIYARYPQYLPAEDEVKLGPSPAPRRWFLDHVVHPASLVTSLMGPASAVTYHRDHLGGGFAILEFPSGAVGCIHLAYGRSKGSFLERLEVLGKETNIVVDNGVHLTYYRRLDPRTRQYGISPSFIGPDDQAPISWEPEFSLGVLYNKQLFLLGYVPEIRYFCKCVIEDLEPEIGGLDHAAAVMKIYEAAFKPYGVRHEL